MTEPEPAANPQALTEEMVEAAARALCNYKIHPCPGKACGPCARSAREVLTAALSFTRPAADCGQIVEECARVAENAALKSPGMLDNTNLQAVHNGACFEIATSIRALSPAPAQTVE